MEDKLTQNNAFKNDIANAITVEEMRKRDAYTIRNIVPGRELMHRAAEGVFKSVDWKGSVIIMAGGGNNGGDGYALADILHSDGVDVCVCKVSDKLSEDGRFYHDKCVKHGIKILSFDNSTDLSQYDMIVDCILGTGFSGKAREPARTAIQKINDARAYVVSVDINSGMNGNTGEGDPVVKSDITVSIGFYKKGHFMGRAPELIRKLVNVDIGIVAVPEN